MNATRWVVGSAETTKPLANTLLIDAVAAGTSVDELAGSADGGQLESIALIPPVPGPAAFAAATDGQEIRSALLWLLSEMQAALKLLGPGGSVVVLLPQGPAMGQSGSCSASAVCGGAMSMARTWAIEFARTGIRVNTVLYGEALVDPDDVSIVPAVAAQVEAFWDRRAESITGQEVFVTGGLDIGRLRP